MTTMASQITSLTVIYSIVYSDSDQRKHQSCTSLAFARGIHRESVNSPQIPRTKGQLHGKCFHLMTSSWDVLVTIWRHWNINAPGCTFIWYHADALLAKAYLTFHHKEFQKFKRQCYLNIYEPSKLIYPASAIFYHETGTCFAEDFHFLLKFYVNLFSSKL